MCPWVSPCRRHEVVKFRLDYAPGTRLGVEAVGCTGHQRGVVLLVPDRARVREGPLSTRAPLQRPFPAGGFGIAPARVVTTCELSASPGHGSIKANGSGTYRARAILTFHRQLLINTLHPKPVDPQLSARPTRPPGPRVTMPDSNRIEDTIRESLHEWCRPGDRDPS